MGIGICQRGDQINPKPVTQMPVQNIEARSIKLTDRLQLFLEDKYIKGKIPTKKITFQQINLINGSQIAIQIHENENLSIQGDSRFQIINPLQYPYSAIGYIQSSKGLPGHSIATGCLIGPNLVLTAAHAVRLTLNQQRKFFHQWNQQEYRKKQVYFYLGAHGPIKKAARILKVKNIYFPKQFEEIEDYFQTQTVDFAILQLQTNEDLTIQFGCLGIDTQWEQITQKVYIVGYPGDRINKKVRQQKLQAYQEYAFLFGEIGLITELSADKKMLYYNKLSTSEGQSGCPIFIQKSEGLYNVVGIHRGTRKTRHTFSNIGVKINKQVLQRINMMISSFASIEQLVSWKEQKKRVQSQVIQHVQQNKWNCIQEFIINGNKLIQMKVINLAQKEIKDITILGYFTSVQQLNLSKNLISNIKVLKQLTSITHLWLDENSITNINIMKSLTSLKILSLKSNHIENISVLGQLKYLSQLTLYDNPIYDITMLKNILALKVLWLGCNHLDVDNQIENLETIKALRQKGTTVWQN